ncbi:hypothetical protein ACQ4PT_064761 [Festuca glaucescens]
MGVRGVLDDIALVAQLSGLHAIMLIALALRLLRIPQCEAECAKLEECARRLRARLQWPAPNGRDVPTRLREMAAGALVEADVIMDSYHRSTHWRRIRTGRSMEARLRGMQDSVNCLCALVLCVHASLLTVQPASDTSATETSRPNDGTPWELFRDAVIQLKDAIQVKLSTEEMFKRKFQKQKEKRKKDKFKHKEELRILKENFRILRQGHEDLKLKIQEMRKDGCSEVDQYKASPSQRSQLIQSTRFRLVIENSVRQTIYKNETVETEDGGDHIKVAMYDGGNPIAPDHPLASVKVDLVVIEGRFNEPKRDSWSKEDFGKSIITPREGMTRLVKNVHTEERVLEGASNPFKVQEAKTKSDN